MKSKMKINPDGAKVWRNSQGQVHNEEGPACILTNGYKAWYIKGNNHREDGPAHIYPNGEKIWIRNDRIIS